MIRFKLFYFFLYISFTTHHFLHLYFRSIGLSGVEIGSIKALSAIMMIVSQPVWGFFCDRLKMRRGLLDFLLFFAGLTFFFIYLENTFLWIFLMVGIYGIFKSPIVPVADSIVMLEVDGDGNRYSQIRLWGGVGLAISVVWMGYFFKQTSLVHLFPTYLIFTYLALFLALFLPRERTCFKERKIKFHEFIAIIRYREFMKFILGILALQTGAFMIDGFFGLFVKERIGNEITLGWALTVAGFSEVVAYFYLSRCQSFLGAKKMLMTSALTSAVRWFLYSKSTLVIQILFLQTLHGVTFGFFYISGVTYVSKLLPREFATSGQTLFWAVAFGIASMFGSILGGFLYDRSTYQILFATAAGLAGVAFGLFWSLGRDVK